MPKNPYVDTPAGVLRKLNEKWKKHHTWVSPTGHAGTDPSWVSPESAYDDNEGTAASWGWGTSPCSYTGYLVLTHDALTSDKIRFKANNVQSDLVSIDLFYDGNWNLIYSGAITGAWQEVEFAEVSTDKMRFRFHVIDYWLGSSMPGLFETDFWEVPPPVVWGGSALPQLQMAKAILGL